MPNRGTARIAVVVLAAVFVLIAAAAVVMNGLLHAMKESGAKRQLSDVTSIAIAIEEYRANHGHLPSRTELAQVGNLGAVLQQKHVFVALTPTTYVVTEAEPGIDVRTGAMWRVVNGRWRHWSRYNPRELVVGSERDILSRRVVR